MLTAFPCSGSGARRVLRRPVALGRLPAPGPGGTVLGRRPCGSSAPGTHDFGNSVCARDSHQVNVRAWLWHVPSRVCAWLTSPFCFGRRSGAFRARCVWPWTRVSLGPTARGPRLRVTKGPSVCSFCFVRGRHVLSRPRTCVSGCGPAPRPCQGRVRSASLLLVGTVQSPGCRGAHASLPGKAVFSGFRRCLHVVKGPSLQFAVSVLPSAQLRPPSAFTLLRPSPPSAPELSICPARSSALIRP